MRPASALTYVEVATLSRDDMMSVLEDFPKSQAVIRQAAMKVAVRRAVVIISEYVRSRQELQSASDQATKASKEDEDFLNNFLDSYDAQQKKKNAPESAAPKPPTLQQRVQKAFPYVFSNSELERIFSNSNFFLTSSIFF